MITKVHFCLNLCPEWFNVYSNVTIDLTTHEAGGISERDFELAGKMNDVLATMRINDG